MEAEGFSTYSSNKLHLEAAAAIFSISGNSQIILYTQEECYYCRHETCWDITSFEITKGLQNFSSKTSLLLCLKLL